MFHRIVSLITLPHSANLRSTKRQADERQNLYVLGLPFSLTKYAFLNYHTTSFNLIGPGPSSQQSFLAMEL